MKIKLKCEKKIAFDSPDHLVPWGTMHDNSKNPIFNRKLYTLYNFKSISVLDMGCSGGGFIRDCVNDGCVAVGLEGSDFSKRHRRAEWAVIPEFLFTCDITRNFRVYIDDKPLLFDVVTSWEVMEHIKEEDIARVCSNVHASLRKGGLWIMSVSPDSDIINGVNLHQTVKPKEWWLKKFAENGFYRLDGGLSYFNGQYVRGKEIPNSFHLILTNDPRSAPKFPSLSLRQRIIDAFVGSFYQRVAKVLINGNYL